MNILDIEGCIITIDEMGTQKKIAEAIIDKKADYILALNGNQGYLKQTSAVHSSGSGLIPHMRPSKKDMEE